MRRRVHLYQPFLEERNVRRLYQLKVWFREREGRRMPMTILLNRILDDFFTVSGSLVDVISPHDSPGTRRTP